MTISKIDAMLLNCDTIIRPRTWEYVETKVKQLKEYGVYTIFYTTKTRDIFQKENVKRVAFDLECYESGDHVVRLDGNEAHESRFIGKDLMSVLIRHEIRIKSLLLVSDAPLGRIESKCAAVVRFTKHGTGLNEPIVVPSIENNGLQIALAKTGVLPRENLIQSLWNHQALRMKSILSMCFLIAMLGDVLVSGINARFYVYLFLCVIITGETIYDYRKLV
ncbi:MAG: hypothetical protein JXK92_10125 [Erysipelotrichaceae bacterium]|nr:hypothetical protein [Erysipelotrichaceae bacterium]